MDFSFWENTTNLEASGGVVSGLGVCFHTFTSCNIPIHLSDVFRLFEVSLLSTLFINSPEVTQIHGYHPVFWLVITRLELGHRAPLNLEMSSLPL